MYSSYATLKGCSKSIEKGEIMNQPMQKKGKLRPSQSFSILKSYRWIYRPSDTRTATFVRAGPL